MGIFEWLSGKVKFYIGGVEMGETVTIDAVELAKDETEPDFIGSSLFKDGVTLTGTFTPARKNGKTGLVWSIIADHYRKQLKKYEEAERKSRQIRHMSYRKQKSQRRRA